MYETKIINLDIRNGKFPISIDRGTPVFLGSSLPIVPSKMGSCGIVIGVGDGKATVYIRSINSASREFISALKSDNVPSLCVLNSRALYVVDGNCDVAGL